MVQYNRVQYSTVQYSRVQCSTVQYSRVQYSTVQYSRVQYNTVQYSRVQYNTVQCGALQRLLTMGFFFSVRSTRGYGTLELLPAPGLGAALHCPPVYGTVL